MPSNVGRYTNALQPPTVRLACSDGQGERNGQLNGPVVRLAHNEIGQGRNCLLGVNGVERIPESMYPALLVSYYYLDGFLERQSSYAYRDWMMDSGAFSAHNSGKAIDLNEYVECCLKLRESDPTLVEIIALDVIGSGEGSLRNAVRMREQGVDAMPVFHIGEDWEILKEYAKGWDKVGLSCRFGEPLKDSYRFYEQCFARIWPKKCHSFGWVDEKMLMRFPFHSSDSSSWETGPCGFGNWKFFGKMSVRGSQQNLKTQIQWYLDLEERLRWRWRREMATLGALPSVAPSVRLAADANSVAGKRLDGAVGREPTVRVVAASDTSSVHRLNKVFGKPKPKE